MHDTIFKTIQKEYGRDIFTTEELATILQGIGYTERQVSAIIRKAIQCRHIGLLSFRELRRKPAKNRLIAIV